MKDLSLFLLKNSFGEKMRKGFRTFCNDDGSTSTLNQHQLPSLPDNNNNESSSSPNYCNNNIYEVGKYDQVHDDTSSNSSAKRAGSGANNNKSSERRRRRRSPPIPTPTPTPSRMTLEDMILKLEMEEEKAARSSAKQQEMEAVRGGRRSSCVNNSNSSSYADNMLLMSARDALNQYPRFSLDGKDAMYRSSFRNNLQASSRMAAAGRRSVCCDYGVVQRMRMNGSSTSNCRGGAAVFGGERVVWCEPGVVAKLMGLEALPMPLRKTNTNTNIVRSSYNHNDDLRRLLVLGTSHHRRNPNPNPNPNPTPSTHTHSNTTTTHHHHCYL